MAELKVGISNDQLVEKISKLYSNSRTYFKPIREDWVNYYKRYKSYLDSSTTKDYYKWRSKLFIPATAKAVDGLLPDLLLTLFGPDPFFAVMPREEADVNQAKIQQAILSCDFYKCDIFLKAYSYLKQMALYGSTFGKVFWNKETTKEVIIKTYQDELTGQTFEKKEFVDVVLYDQPWFEPIDIFNIAWAKNCTNLKDTWIIQRSEKTIGEMKSAGVYENIDKLEDCIIGMKGTAEYEQEVRNWLKGLPSAFNDEEGDARKVEILEYWNQDRSKTATIAGQRVVVRKYRDNPYGLNYDPFIKSDMWQNPFEFLGTGIPEKSKDLQDQLNSEVNQRLDNRTLRQNVQFKVRRGANINTRALRSGPGAIWLTDDMDALDVVNIPDISSNNSFNEENMLEQKIEEITGVTKYSTGAGADSRRTATEVNTLTKMSSKGFALHVKCIEESFIKPLIKKFMYLNSRFSEKDRVIRIIGKEGYEFIKVTPEDLLKTDYDLIAQGSSELTDKNLKVQQMVNYKGMIASDPTAMAMSKALDKRIWEAWGNKDYEVAMKEGQAMLPPPPPPPAPEPKDPPVKMSVSMSIEPSDLADPAVQLIVANAGVEVMPKKQENIPMAPDMSGFEPSRGVGLPPQVEGGVPIEPTGMREGSPMEGGIPMQMGGGGPVR